jgi:hypothetical protein
VPDALGSRFRGKDERVSDRVRGVRTGPLSSWLDSLPESLAESAAGEALRAITDRDLRATERRAAARLRPRPIRCRLSDNWLYGKFGLGPQSGSPSPNNQFRVSGLVRLLRQFFERAPVVLDNLCSFGSIKEALHLKIVH